MQTQSTVEFNRRSETFNEQPTKRSDSEPLLEIEMASANHCQVRGTVSARNERERPRKRENGKKAEIVPLHSNSSCERRVGGCLHKRFMRLLIVWAMAACCLCVEVTISAPF